MQPAGWRAWLRYAVAGINGVIAAGQIMIGIFMPALYGWSATMGLIVAFLDVLVLIWCWALVRGRRWSLWTGYGLAALYLITGGTAGGDTGTAVALLGGIQFGALALAVPSFSPKPSGTATQE